MRVPPIRSKCENDIVKFLFNASHVNQTDNLVPCVFASERFIGQLFGCEFKTIQNVTGYYKKDDCSFQDILLNWFRTIEGYHKTMEANRKDNDKLKKDMEQLKLQKTIEVETLKNKMVDATQTNTKLMETCTKNEELSNENNTLKSRMSLLSSELTNARNLQNEQDETIQELQRKNTVLTEQADSWKTKNECTQTVQCQTESTCDLKQECKTLREQLKEKDKHILWLLNKAVQQPSSHTQEANLIDLLCISKISNKFKSSCHKRHS
jgi:hypothetical protein